MKKLLTISAILVFATMFTSPGFAKLISDPPLKTHCVRFTSPASKTDADGVEIYAYNAIGGTKSQVNFVSDIKTGKTKVTYGATPESDNYGDKKSVLTAIGLYIQFVNSKSAPAVISWKNSSISSGDKNFGVPFLEGMKYMDAGNPSATPDTIILPGQKVLKKVFIPNVKFVGSRWTHDGVTITPSKDVSITLVLSVNGKFFTVVTPGINFVLNGK